MRIGNPGFTERIEREGQRLRLARQNDLPLIKSFFLHRPRQFDCSPAGLPFESLNTINHQHTAANAGILDQFRNAMAEIECMCDFSLTGFRELFGAQPDRPLEVASRSDELRYHSGFSASRFTGNHDNIVCGNLRSQSRFLIDARKLNRISKYAADAAHVFPTEGFDPAPVGPEIRMVLKIKARPQGPDQFWQIEIPACGPVFRSQTNQPVPQMRAIFETSATHNFRADIDILALCRLRKAQYPHPRRKPRGFQRINFSGCGFSQTFENSSLRC